MPSTSNIGQSVTFTATVTGAGGTPTGIVTFNFGDGSAVVPGTLIGGTVSISHSYAAGGSFTAIATYSGDSIFGTSLATFTQTVLKTTSTALTPVPNPSTAGQPVTFSATVTGAGGTPTGTVTFDFGDGTNLQGTLAGGVATVTHAYAAGGSFTVHASYNGDSVFATSVGTVTQNVGTAAHFAITAPGAVTAGVPFVVTVTALDGFGNTATGYTGTVHFTSTDGAAVLPANSTLTNGVGTFSITLRTAGVQTITAADTVTASINGSNTLTVSAGAVTHLAVTAPPNATAGTAFNFTIIALDGSGNTATSYNGTVHFTSTDGAAVLPANFTLTNGVGTVAATLNTPGYRTITATDTTTPAITGTSGAINVSGTATHFAVSAPANATPGTSFSFTVTALDAGGNISAGYTGTVHFTSSDGAAILPANSTLTNGVGTFSATLNTSGARTITATDTVTAAITGTASINVGFSATSLALTSSLNPSQVGQAVTFTATVSSSGGTPSGTVTFKDGAVVLGTAALANAIATFATSSLTLGSHSITASYAGAATFAASTSAALTQVVNTPTDSLKLRALQVMAAPVAARVSGQAISGAIDNAIAEGFSGGGTFVTPSGGGLRFNFAADPDAKPAGTAQRSTDPFTSANGSFASGGRGFAAQPSTRADGASSSRVDDAFGALAYAGPTKAPPRIVEPRDWLGWAEVAGATLDHWGSSTALGMPTAVPALYGNQVNFLAGLTRRLLPNFLVGVVGGYETFDYRSDALQGRLKGDGWTVGSYLGWMLTPSVRFDAAVAYSGIGYDGTAGTATGTFDGHRLLASGGLTGIYQSYGFKIEPSARVFALWEHENAYTDSLGTLQAARDFSTGRASGGVKVAYPIAWTSTVMVAPYVGVYGDYYFNTDNAGTVTIVPAVPTIFVLDGWSARAIGGVAATFANGAQVAVGGERSGIGGNFALWTYRARASVPFSAQ